MRQRKCSSNNRSAPKQENLPAEPLRKWLANPANRIMLPSVQDLRAVREQAATNPQPKKRKSQQEPQTEAAPAPKTARGVNLQPGKRKAPVLGRAWAVY